MFLPSLSLPHSFTPKTSPAIEDYFAKMPLSLANSEIPSNSFQEEILAKIIGADAYPLELKNWMRSVLNLHTCAAKNFEDAFKKLLPQIKALGTKDAIANLLTGLYLLLNSSQERTRKQRELLISHLSILLDGGVQYLPSKYPLTLYINIQHIDLNFVAQLDTPKAPLLSRQKAIKIAALIAISGCASVLFYALRNTLISKPIQPTANLSSTAMATADAYSSHVIEPAFNVSANPSPMVFLAAPQVAITSPKFTNPILRQLSSALNNTIVGTDHPQNTLIHPSSLGIAAASTSTLQDVISSNSETPSSAEILDERCLIADFRLNNSTPPSATWPIITPTLKNNPNDHVNSDSLAKWTLKIAGIVSSLVIAKMAYPKARIAYQNYLKTKAKDEENKRKDLAFSNRMANMQLRGEFDKFNIVGRLKRIKQEREKFDEDWEQKSN